MSVNVVGVQIQDSAGLAAGVRHLKNWVHLLLLLLTFKIRVVCIIVIIHRMLSGLTLELILVFVLEFYFLFTYLEVLRQLLARKLLVTVLAFLSNGAAYVLGVGFHQLPAIHAVLQLLLALLNRVNSVNLIGFLMLRNLGVVVVVR